MHGVPLAASNRSGRDFVFKFQDTSKQVGALAITFANSESSRFADCVRRLKKVTVNNNNLG